MTTTKGRFNEKSIESLSMGIGIISVVVLLTTGGSISIASMVLLSTVIINRLVIRLTRPIINASGFDDKKLEICNVLLLLLVGLPIIIYIIVTCINKAFKEYISTVSPSNTLYNSVMTIYKSWQGLYSLFSSPIGLIIIILVVLMVAVTIALEKRSFSSYTGT